jgi:hypothetical protein
MVATKFLEHAEKRAKERQSLAGQSAAPGRVAEKLVANLPQVSDEITLATGDVAEEVQES